MRLLAATTLLIVTCSVNAGLYSEQTPNAYETTCVSPILKIQQQRRESSFDPVIKMFQAADINKDQRVCRDELLDASPEKILVYASYDLNGDYCVTPMEVTTKLRQQLILFWRGDHRIMDLNRDGVITLDELKRRYGHNSGIKHLAPIDILDEYDGNFDGEITPDEYVARSWEIMRILEGRLPLQ